MRTFLLFLSLLVLAGSAQAQQRGAIITNIAPTFGPAGTTVSIRGVGLNGFEPVTAWVKEIANEPPPGIVEFNGVPGEILFWQDDLITVKVPKGASSGPVRVIVPRATIVATEFFDVYYASTNGRPANSRQFGSQPSQSPDANNSIEREPRIYFDDQRRVDPFFVNPWFSGLSPGERTFLGEQGFTNTFLFGNPFSRGRSLFSGRDGFRGNRFGRFGFQNPFFGSSLFHGSRLGRISPFWFRFR